MDKTGDEHFSIFFSLKEVGAFVFVGGEIRSLLPLGRLVLCLGTGSLSGTLSISLVSVQSQVTLSLAPWAERKISKTFRVESVQSAGDHRHTVTPSIQAIHSF